MKKKLPKFVTLLLLFLIVFLHQSCIKTPAISYFQSADSLRFKELVNIEPKVSRIQRDDILAITVSSLSQESNEILNFANINALTTTSFPGQQGGVQRSQPLGYLVDSSGKVEIPFVGRVKIIGQTLEEASSTVRAEVIKYLKEPAVNVRFLNHKFSILGEVNRPSTYNLLDDKTTILEALAMAGDLTVYGNRQDVVIIRENNGVREMAKVSLKTQEIFSSPYYFLRNGDMIYIEPIKEKATFNDQRVQLAPIYLSVTTTAVVFLSLIINIFK